MGEKYFLHEGMAQSLNFKGIASLYKGDYAEAFQFHK
jgi:hypothetical protein